MKYRLIHKKLGVKSYDVSYTFEYPDKIKDVCFVKDTGFLCLGKDSILLVKSNSCEKILSIDNPMSICLGNAGLVYVIYNNGVKSFNCKDCFYALDVLNNHNKTFIYGLLGKIGIRNLCIDYYDGIMAISIPDLHKFYVLRKMAVDRAYGSGVPEYSISSNLQQCSMNAPKGILVYDKNNVIVSDTDNGCIRMFGDFHRILAGNPLDKAIYPTKLLVNREKDILYYLSKNYLRSIAMNDNREAILYENEHIISMTIGDDGKVYVLEGEE